MIFVSSHEATEVLQPGEQTFDFPTFSVTTKQSTVLCWRTSAVDLVRGDYFHTEFYCRFLVQLVRVVRLATDHFMRQIIQDARVKYFFDQRHFMWASAACVHGERNTASVDKAHDFGAFAALGLPHASVPFFAGANASSMKPSLRSMPPRSRRSSARATNTCSKNPSSLHCWNRRWQTLFGGYRSAKSFQSTPVRSTHRVPLSTSRGLTAGRPRLPGPLRGSGRNEEIRFHCLSVMSITP